MMFMFHVDVHVVILLGLEFLRFLGNTPLLLVLRGDKHDTGFGTFGIGMAFGWIWGNLGRDHGLQGVMFYVKSYVRLHDSKDG